MWLIAIALACGGGETPAVPTPDPRAPKVVSVHEVPEDYLGRANGLAANKLLGALLGQGPATACLGEGGTAQLERIGFTLTEAGAPLELVVHSGRPDVDDCLREVHRATDYSEVIVPVPFEVETTLAGP